MTSSGFRDICAWQATGYVAARKYDCVLRYNANGSRATACWPGAERWSHHGETGYQKSHTSLGTDLEKMAMGAGIRLTRTIEQQAGLAAGARLIREANATSFVLLRVKPTDPPSVRRNIDPPAGRIRFRAALSGRDR
jgi:hypothetical protein